MRRDRDIYHAIEAVDPSDRHPSPSGIASAASCGGYLMKSISW